MVSVSSIADFLSGTHPVGGASASAFVFIDSQFRFQRAGGPLLERLGLSAAELVGQSFHELFPELVAELGADPYHQALRGQSATNITQYAGRTISSRMLPLHGEKGEVEGVFIYCQEITAEQQDEAQHQASERLRQQALKNAPIALWQQDKQLRYRWIYNPQVGHQVDEMIGKRDVDLMERREDAERAEAVKREVLVSGVGRREELTIVRRGHKHIYDVTIEPLLDVGGAVHGIICAAWDITYLAELESQLKNTVAELAKRDQSQKEQVQALSRALTEAERNERQRIAQVLHDDIQQMLMAAQIRLDMLEGSVSADAGSQFAELQGLLEAITGATRSLSVELRAETLQSEQLGEILVWTASIMAEQYHLQVEVETEGPCTVSNHSTRELIYKSVRELLFNVVKHGGVEEARVSARTEGDDVVISVADQGAGFDVDDAMEAASAGESFGLSSVRERIMLFGGHCDIHSAPGQGTRVTIVLPRFSR